MKIKCLGLSALIGALALLILTSAASATTLTGSGGETLGTGTTISAENAGTLTLDSPIGDIECASSKISGKTTNSGGTGVNVTGNIESLSFSSCNATVTVLAKGSFSIEGTGSSNGILRFSGTEITVEFLGFHCIFKETTSSSGTVVTGALSVGGYTYYHFRHKTSRTGGRSGAFCGTEAEWTGAYKGTNPSAMNIDK